MNVFAEFLRLRALVFDVDGVMTNGSLLLTEEGNFLRTFNIRDGYAIRRAIECGLKIVVISGGNSKGVERRLESIGVQDIYLGANDKLPVLKSWMESHGMDPTDLAYMGDDILDAEAMQHVLIRACPADAAPEIKAISNYFSSYKGGEGCVRDLIEQVLKAQNQWYI